MGFIGKWISKGYISNATGRAIELGILGTLSALIVGLLDNVDIILHGGTIDWNTFIVTFCTATALTITAWMKKKARDLVPSDSSEMI